MKSEMKKQKNNIEKTKEQINIMSREDDFLKEMIEFTCRNNNFNI